MAARLCPTRPVHVGPEELFGGSATPVAAPTAPPLRRRRGLRLRRIRRVHQAEGELEAGRRDARQQPICRCSRSDRTGAAASRLRSPCGRDGRVTVSRTPRREAAEASHLPAGVLINFAILETSDGFPVVVLGPEVSLAADGSTPIGSTRRWASAPQAGGAPIALMAGELHGTTLTNHSGRFGYDKSVTSAALDDAASLFKILSWNLHPPRRCTTRQVASPTLGSYTPAATRAPAQAARRFTTKLTPPSAVFWATTSSPSASRDPADQGEPDAAVDAGPTA